MSKMEVLKLGKIDGAVIVAQMLKNAGVDCIFTLSGGHIFRIYQECQKLGIRVLDTRHEGAAAYAAMAYAQASGKIGVLVATAGPGVTNALTAVVDSKIIDVPLLVIGGGAAVTQELTETLQEYDTTSIMNQATLWSKRCSRVEHIPKYMEQAIRACIGVHPGPVYLELPMDVLEKDLVKESNVVYPVSFKANKRTGASPDVVSTIADLLISAQRPAILIGQGAQYYAEDLTAFKDLSEYLQIPTSVDMTNKGRFFKEDKPLFRTGEGAAGQADVVLGFNYKTDLSDAGNINPEAKWVSIHTDSNFIGLNRKVDIGVVGHSDIIARQIYNAVKDKTEKRSDNPWVDAVWKGTQDALSALDKAAFLSDLKPMHPARLAHEVQQFMNTDGKNYIQVFDGGDCLVWEMMASTMKMDDPGAFKNRCFHSSKFGTIGHGFGTVLGVWAATGKKIVFTTGDGSFGQYIGELFSYAKHDIPVIVVISNDSNYGMIKAFAMADTPDDDVDIGQVICQECGKMFMYDKIAQAWEGHGEVVTDPSDIPNALRRAAKTNKPSIINAEVICREDCFSPGTVNLYKMLKI